MNIQKNDQVEASPVFAMLAANLLPPEAQLPRTLGVVHELEDDEEGRVTLAVDLSDDFRIVLSTNEPKLLDELFVVRMRDGVLFDSDDNATEDPEALMQRFDDLYAGADLQIHVISRKRVDEDERNPADEVAELLNDAQEFDDEEPVPPLPSLRELGLGLSPRSRRVETRRSVMFRDNSDTSRLQAARWVLEHTSSLQLDVMRTNMMNKVHRTSIFGDAFPPTDPSDEDVPVVRFEMTGMQEQLYNSAALVMRNYILGRELSDASGLIIPEERKRNEEK